MPSAEAESVPVPAPVPQPDRYVVVCIGIVAELQCHPTGLLWLQHYLSFSCALGVFRVFLFSFALFRSVFAFFPFCFVPVYGATTEQNKKTT